MVTNMRYVSPSAKAVSPNRGSVSSQLLLILSLTLLVKEKWITYGWLMLVLRLKKHTSL